MFDVCVCYGPHDSDLGARVITALEAAGLTATPPGQGSAPEPSQLGVPLVDFGGARLGVVLITRMWTAVGGLRSVIALAEKTGTRLVLVWWNEDAPSDFAGDRRPDEHIFFACYLPPEERIPALVARVKSDLSSVAPSA
jgi:hypothetical protein